MPFGSLCVTNYKLNGTCRMSSGCSSSIQCNVRKWQTVDGCLFVYVCVLCARTTFSATMLLLCGFSVRRTNNKIIIKFIKTQANVCPIWARRISLEIFNSSTGRPTVHSKCETMRRITNQSAQRRAKNDMNTLAVPQSERAREGEQKGTDAIVIQWTL